MSSNGGRSFGMLMWEDFSMELFFLAGTCLGKVIGLKKEVLLLEMVVLMLGAKLTILLEVVILV